MSIVETVIFIKENFLENLSKIVKKDKLIKGKTAVKIHMGEYGNLTHLRPQVVEAVVSALKANGAKPFVFDTPTLYKGSRSTAQKYLETAKKNGFSKETIGCPIIISDKSKSLKGKKFLKEVNASQEILKADCLVVLSHFKGHGDAGFGGCIKNIGMGCVSKKSKKDQHTLSQPVLEGNCTGCGSCEKACKQKAIKVTNGKAKINCELCYGCCACVQACPVHALRPKTASVRVLLAEATATVLENFPKEKTLFINVLFDITKDCDCCAESKIICENIGIVVSKDIVAADKAALDLLEQKAGNILETIEKVNPQEQIQAGIEFNLGSKEYKLEEIE